ncbi:MAG: GAF domain-containing protein, partial [Rubrivivax sp.]
SEIERLSLPARVTLAAPAEDAGAPVTPEELLLHLCGQRQRLAAAPPPEALAELKAASARILGLASVVRLPLGHSGLSPVEQPRYIDLLTRHGAPLALPDAALHPCHAELSGLPGAAEARIEVPLYDGAQLAGALWLVDARATRAWTRQELLIASQLALLFEAQGS